jgi:hypothetical protein
MSGWLNPKLKIGRAKEHLDALRSEISAFMETQPYRSSAYDDAESGQYVIEVRIAPAIPHKIGLLAGDFISCLRASLDHLAWQLALLSTPTPFSRTCFPVCEIYDTTGGTEGFFCSVTKDIPPRAVDIIRELQPYQSGGAFQLSHLWRLNKLWNIEKHRKIPTIGSITENILTTQIGVKAEIGQVNDCHTIKIPLSEKSKVRFNPQPAVELQFGGEAEGITITTTDLFGIYDFIGDKVLPRFEGFFPKEEPRGQTGILKVFERYRR